MKQIFEITPYLLILQNKKSRNAISKLRLSPHPLNIETGRHRNVIREDRKCTLCRLNDKVDDDHFTLICSFYNDLRKEYLQKYYYVKQNFHKYISLMNSSKLKVLNNLAIYII